MPEARLDIVMRAKDKATATMKKVSSGLGQVARDTKKLQAAQAAQSGVVGRVKHAFSGLGGALGKAGVALGVFGVAALGLKAAAGVIGSVVSALRGVAEKGRDIQDTAVSVGLSAQEFQRLSFATKMAGTDINRILPAMAKLGRIVRDAAAGKGEAATKMRRMGIAATDAQGRLKGANAVMLEIADRFKGMESGAEKSALALDFFEESGFRLIPFLNQGAEGIRRMGLEADRLGVVLDQEVLAQTTAAAQAFTRMDAAVEGLKNQIAIAFIPEMEHAAVVMRNMAVAMRGADDDTAKLSRTIRGELRAEFSKATTDAAEVTAALKTMARDSRDSAQAAEILGTAQKEAFALIEEGAQRAAPAFGKARDMAERYYNTPGLRGDVTRMTRSAVRELAKARLKANEVVDRARVSIERLATSEGRQLEVLKQTIAITKGQTLAQIAATEAQKRWNDALKQGNKVSISHLANLAKILVQRLRGVQEEKKADKPRGVARGISKAKLAAELAKLTIAERAHAAALAEANPAKAVGIQHDAKMAALAIDLKASLITRRDGLLAVAKINAASARAEAKALVQLGKTMDKEDKAEEARRRARAAAQLDLDVQRESAKLAVAEGAAAKAVIQTALAQLQFKKDMLAASADATTQAIKETQAHEALVESQRKINEEKAKGEEVNDRLASSMGAVSSALMSSSMAMQAMNTDLSLVMSGTGELAAAVQSYADGQEGATDRGLAAAGLLTAGLVKDERQKAAILALMELARGVASIEKGPIVAGAHFAAAAMFGAIAGGAIKTSAGGSPGGGRGAAKSGGGFSPSGREEGGGAQQVIVTFGDGIILGTPGQVGKAVSEATGALGGTGMQAAGAF